MRRVALIVNPSSGGGKAAKVLPAVEDALRAVGVTFHTERTRSIDHVRELALAAHEAGEVAVTLSGDGCVGAVAGALSGIDGATMGVLPGGRGNDFARVAGIPLDAVEATAVIAMGTPRPVDLGEVDGKPFVGIASLGFDSVANELANEAPSQLGNLVYAYAALRAVATWKHAQFTVTVDGAVHEIRGWSVAVANSGAYGGGMRLAPDAKLDDGLLDVVLSEASSKAHFLASLPKVFKGTHVEDPRIHVLQGREITIAADRAFDVYADGDPIGALPATVRVRPHAVQVLLP
ncbi:MAG TPA: diacylglycerol kinase family protein [Solirubrobacteraceae bacterium]